MDGGDKLEGFRRLNNFIEVVESSLRPEADLSTLMAHEMAISPPLGGRSVQRGRERTVRHGAARQMSLF
jgi:hypothetical protein